MKSYQRALTVIRGRTPDLVPAYTPTIACDVASKLLGREVNAGSPSLSYADAKAWLAGKEAYSEFESKLTENLIALNSLLRNDVIRFPLRSRLQPKAEIEPDTFLVGDPDGVHAIWQWDGVVRNFIQVKNTARKYAPEEWGALARENVKHVEARAAAARREYALPEQALQQRLGDRFLVAASGATLWVGVDEESLMACLVDPGAVGEILDCQLQVALAVLEAAAERGIKVVLGGGDMADKNSTLYSPQVFNDLALPRWKKLIARAIQLGIHYVWRSDGKLWSVTDALFKEAQAPGFGEVDRDAGMDVARLRARYPDLVIWANVSGDLLRRGTEAEVYADSLTILRESQGRRYFHGCSNTILPGTPPENVLAMLRARDDFRPIP